MRFLRTPDEQFEQLGDFPFQPRYVDIDSGEGESLRMHYVDEGPSNAELVLCVHGQPVWSYSFRKMIPLLTTAGYRVIAPDLIGFGRSDKPASRSDYTFARHVAWMRQFIVSLDLTDITLLCQDWRGPITLRVLSEMPHRFARVVATNTGLGDAKGIPEDRAPVLRARLAATEVLPIDQVTENLRSNNSDPLAFMYWIRHCDAFADFAPAEVMREWLLDCPDEVDRGYAAPFPDEAYLQGARQFPSLVPLLPDDPSIPDNRKTWELLRTFERPFLTAFSEFDGQGEKRFQSEVPGARGQTHVRIENAQHYPQEDAPDALAHTVIQFMRANPLQADL